MSIGVVVDLFRQAFMTSFWICLPLLLIGFIVGIVMSLIQIVTSMQDASFAAVPRLTAFLFGLLLLLPWMTTRLVTYTTLLFGDFAKYAK